MSVTTASLTTKPPGKRRDAAATQRRLLQSAEIEFARHGYKGARLRNIAARAGVQSALIHHYFADKEGLYRAMLGTALEESSSQSWEILGRQGSFRDMAERFVTHLLAFNEEHHNLLTILRHEARVGSVAAETTRQVVHDQVTPLLAAAVAYLRGLQSTGTVRADCDLEELIMTALALCSYPFTERPFLEACLPSRLVTDDASRRARGAQIVATLTRIACP